MIHNQASNRHLFPAGARRLGTAVVLLGVALAFWIGGAPTAHAADISSPTGTVLRGCTYKDAPASSGLNPGLCAPLMSLPQGTQLSMLCWKDDYGQRWFLIKTASGYEGYVQANAVGHQVTVSHCAAGGPVTRKVLAVDWAFLTVGQTMGGEDIKYFYSAQSWAEGPRGEFSGDCIKLAHFAWYKATGVYSYMSDAINVWRFYSSRGLAGPANQPPPYGAMIFYGTTIDPRGHVGIAAGGTRIVDTKGVDRDGKPVAWEDYRDIPGFVGWVPIENLRSS
jgi:hypothetical protein